MTDYSKITALYSRLSVGDEDRDGGESNSIQNQKIFLENYARGQHLTNIRHYIDDDESGRFFDRSAYSRMMDDVENGKIGVCIMKDLTRWGRDYLQVGNAMEIFRRNNVRFIAVNNGIDSEKPDTLEFAPFINIMSEWYAKDISKKVKTGIKTKGMSGKPIVTEAPYSEIRGCPDFQHKGRRQGRRSILDEIGNAFVLRPDCLHHFRGACRGSEHEHPCGYDFWHGGQGG